MPRRKITAKDFLDAHRLAPGVFATGLFYSGITIYNQQVRTLNLLYQLKQRGNLQSAPREVVIIGGGVSGITAAMALQRLGYTVSLLEEKSILLHLQHGCTTRKIHPHLYKWPEFDSLKPFTELPIANWDASDAATIERNLMQQFGKACNSGAIKVYYQVSSLKINTSNKTVGFKHLDINDKQFNPEVRFSLLLVATGFGLERFVGRKDKAKSYWRNDDYAQLRISNQIKKFLVTGVGDGGAYDVCRLRLMAFDPVNWASLFESISFKGQKLIDGLRQIHSKAILDKNYNLKADFEEIYIKFKRQLDILFSLHKRHDIDSVVLNGRETFEGNLNLSKLSFINCWLLFLLHRKEYIKYEKGDFPDDCGEWLFIDDDDKEHIHIVRHGVDIDKNKIKEINPNFTKAIERVKNRQKNPDLNEFSRVAQWPLQFWSNTPDYSPKKFVVSKKFQDSVSIFLNTIAGQISHYALEKFGQAVDFRVTLHRLVRQSDEYLFQQVADYSGTRRKSDGDVGRAFPISEGVVGLAMRNSTGLYLNGVIGKLFQYKKLFARTLPVGVTSLMAIPIPPKDQKYGSLLCLYLDTKEDALVQDITFRKNLYWGLISFIKHIDFMNVGELGISQEFERKNFAKSDSKILKDPLINNLNSELKKFWRDSELRFSENKLIELYDKD